VAGNPRTAPLTLDAKLKHLEFAQNAINRMAQNSFLLKGWSITLVGGLLALSFKEMNHLYITISAAVLLFFWFLDSYYLRQERLFIKLYDHIRGKHDKVADFSMDTRPYRKEVSWYRCWISTTMILFYGGLLVVDVIVAYLI
jgi:hypothetical protein